MNVLYSILLFLLFAFPFQDGRKFMIMEMNSSYVLIDSKVMQEGDVFEEGAEVWWCFRGQSMEVMDINTSKMYKFAAVNNHRNNAALEDFRGYRQPLSTNDADPAVAAAGPVSYFYITYIHNGAQKKEILDLNLDLASLPKSIALYRYDHESKSHVLQTEDFRGFLRNLAEADRKAKDQLAETDYYVGEEQKLVDDYMALMRKFTEPRFKTIDYTYKDLKMFLKL